MRSDPFQTIVNRIAAVVQIAAPPLMLAGLRQRFERLNLTAAVARRDTPALFDWLMPVLSYQGVSDAIAWSYMDQRGMLTYADVAADLQSAQACTKLRSYWHFADCGFAKRAFTCNRPEHIEHCPLPRHDLRNGRLNQTAFSLFLFLRDVCEGDLVGWIDQRLQTADCGPGSADPSAMRGALLEPLGGIYGVSSKVLAMALADLLLAADPARQRWVAAGASMIAVDTLVHNWLHRSGCLRDLGAEHAYGPRCYAPGGCAEIIEAVSAGIDARRYCPEGPANFPRLVQKAIWRLCTEGALGWCNGNRIDDWCSCAQFDCPIASECARLPLRLTSSMEHH